MSLLDSRAVALTSAALRRRLYVGGRFAAGAPSPQSAIDAVPGPWASRVPLADVRTGEAELFDDERARWAIDTLGGVAEARCLELGPLEGGHSYMLHGAGAAHVVSVEANRESFLKCLVVKELLGLERCSFLCGDAIEYLRGSEEQFDLCWCAGFLYHMVDPVGLIELITPRASRLYMWTHYYDAAALAPGTPKGKPFAKGEVTESERGGFRHRLHRHDYGAATRLPGFWGGTQAHSNWLSQEDLIGALEHFGWSGIETRIDAGHPHGPALDLVAVRS
jgi:hypothetical protein